MLGWLAVSRAGANRDYDGTFMSDLVCFRAVAIWSRPGRAISAEVRAALATAFVGGAPI
jgi:hypothetical protein